MNYSRLPLVAALTAAGLLAQFDAVAATYQYRAYIPGLSATTLPPPAAVLSLALAPSQLPALVQDAAYAVDFKPLLTSANSVPFDVSAVNWSLSGGTLPSGLTLNSTTGVLGGVPPATNGAPVSFSVTAAYGNKTATQSYVFPAVTLPIGTVVPLSSGGIVGLTPVYLDSQNRLWVWPGKNSTYDATTGTTNIVWRYLAPNTWDYSAGVNPGAATTAFITPIANQSAYALCNSTYPTATEHTGYGAGDTIAISWQCFAGGTAYTQGRTYILDTAGMSLAQVATSTVGYYYGVSGNYEANHAAVSPDGNKVFVIHETSTISTTDTLGRATKVGAVTANVFGRNGSGGGQVGATTYRLYNSPAVPSYSYQAFAVTNSGSLWITTPDYMLGNVTSYPSTMTLARLTGAAATASYAPSYEGAVYDFDSVMNWQSSAIDPVTGDLYKVGGANNMSIFKINVTTKEVSLLATLSTRLTGIWIGGSDGQLYAVTGTPVNEPEVLNGGTYRINRVIIK